MPYKYHIKISLVCLLLYKSYMNIINESEESYKFVE